MNQHADISTDEYNKTASHKSRNAGLSTLLLALISTQLKLASDFFQLIADFLGPKYEEGKSKANHYAKQAQDTADEYTAYGKEKLNELAKKGDEYTKQAQNKAGELQKEGEKGVEQAKKKGDEYAGKAEAKAGEVQKEGEKKAEQAKQKAQK